MVGGLSRTVSRHLGYGRICCCLSRLRRRQIPVSEETDPRNPYRHAWSGMVVNTPHRFLPSLAVFISPNTQVTGAFETVSQPWSSQLARPPVLLGFPSIAGGVVPVWAVAGGCPRGLKERELQNE